MGTLYEHATSPDPPTTGHCGRFKACIDTCPTKAIVAPYQLDARRCISYLTIELHGSIPIEFRNSIGNRIYGCDDCQLVFPWNRHAKITVEPDFQTRYSLNNTTLLTLFDWNDHNFFRKQKVLRYVELVTSSGLETLLLL